MPDQQPQSVSSALQNAFGGNWTSPDDGRTHVGAYDHKAGRSAQDTLDKFRVHYLAERTGEGFLIRTNDTPTQLLKATSLYNKTLPKTSQQKQVGDWDDSWKNMRNPNMKLIHQQNALRYFLDGLNTNPDGKWRYNRAEEPGISHSKGSYILSLPASPDDPMELNAVEQTRAALLASGFAPEQLHGETYGDAYHFVVSPKDIVWHPKYDAFRAKFDALYKDDPKAKGTSR